MRVGIAENIIKVKGERSRSYVYTVVAEAEAYITTAWSRGSFISS